MTLVVPEGSAFLFIQIYIFLIDLEIKFIFLFSSISDFLKFFVYIHVYVD